MVRVTGEIDMSNVSELKSALDATCADSPQGFVVDASELDYIDSSGIRAILEAWHCVREAGGVLAVVTSDIVRRLLDILAAENIPSLHLCDNIESAVAALSGKPPD